MAVLASVRPSTTDHGDTHCDCTSTFEADELVVDATDCPDDGILETSECCRATVIEALTERDVERVVVRTNGVERVYQDRASALLVAAGRFVEQIERHDPELARTARSDPVAACRAATARPPPISEIAAETGLAITVQSAHEYEALLRPEIGATVASARVRARPPAGAALLDVRDLSTESEARIYREPRTDRRRYFLLPAVTTLASERKRLLADAYERLASGAIDGDERAPGRAVRAVTDPEVSEEIGILTRILRKHTREFGAITDLLSDPKISDVFVTTPVEENPVRVLYDGDRLATNVRLTEQGTAALASKFRRASGRAFSRASPTLAATTSAGRSGGAVRVAGVTDPVSDGPGFVFREHGGDAMTLPGLVASETLPAAAAALLSVAVERSAAGLIAGTRGAGKTTTLGALLWELPESTRTVVIEDTPELPVEQLQATGRDVQALETAVDAEDGPGIEPSEALRTALRLGEGALVLGEVRGEEARVLYEAMRVGASGSAVLGTIHGSGGDAVRERVVSDLGVPESSFGVTEFVVTLEAYQGPDGRSRRVRAIEELLPTDGGVAFEALYELEDGQLVPTGRIRRGESRLVGSLARSNGGYSAVRERLQRRESLLTTLASAGKLQPNAVTEAYARRRNAPIPEFTHPDCEVDTEPTTSRPPDSGVTE